MMNKRHSAIMALALAMMVFLTPLNVCAVTTEVSGEAVFNGSSIQSNFNGETIAKQIEDLQPGDEVIYTITYTNDSSETTDWYMENQVIKTLEDLPSRKKAVSGTSEAENGGYTYELIHYDKDGNPDMLFTNEKVGGEAKPTEDLQGLRQATDALDEWFFIQTLAPGETGTVVLRVAFEGETEVNDYMDTDGEVNVRFAVEVRGKEGKKVKTGDFTNVRIWMTMFVAAGLLLLALTLVSLRRDRRAVGSHDRTGGDA